jgi:hypothetical protein
MKITTIKSKTIPAISMIKQYGVVLAFIFPILILVLFRSVDPYNFKTDVTKQAEASFLQSNIVPIGQINSMQGSKLIISLDKEIRIFDGTDNKMIEIPADSVLNKSNLKTIRSHVGPVLLSGDLALTSRIWMILSQLGFSNIFILTNDPGNEKPVNQN